MTNADHRQIGMKVAQASYESISSKLCVAIPFAVDLRELNFSAGTTRWGSLDRPLNE
jgi:hypothetical protein